MGICLLSFEDMLIELLLQPLIGKIDTELLKAVFLKALKTVDVQNTYGVFPLLSFACSTLYLRRGEHLPVMACYTTAKPVCIYSQICYGS